MEFQSLSSIKDKLEYLFKTNPNRSLSGTFKALRREQRIDLISDCILIGFILRYGYSRTPKYVWNRNQVLRAIRISGFYKDEGRKHAYVPKEWEKYINDQTKRK